MQSTTNPSLRFDDSPINGRPDWCQLLKKWDYLHHTIISIYDTTKDHFVFFNQSVTNILGYGTCHFREFKTVDWVSMIHEKEQSRAAGFFQARAVPADGKNTSFQYHIRHQQGHWVYVNHEQNFVEYQSKLWIVNLIMDVTEKEMFNKYLYTLRFSKHQYTPNGSGRHSQLEDLDISARELEVVRLIGSGFSSKEIADKLFISSHTAITHRKNLIRKFKVKNTAQLIKEATKRMLLS